MCRRGATFAILHLGFFSAPNPLLAFTFKPEQPRDGRHQPAAATGWQTTACHSPRVLFQHGLLRGVIVLTAASLAKAFSHQIPHPIRLDLGHISVV